MAMLPCIVGPHRHADRNINLYIGLARGGETLRASSRVCPTHWSAVEDYLSEFEVDPDDLTTGRFGPRTKCVACLEPAGELDRQFFLTCYPTKNQREDYWAQLHDSCSLPGFLGALQLKPI